MGLCDYPLIKIKTNLPERNNSMNSNWMFSIRSVFIIAVLGVAALQPVAATLIVDRGLPTANLNNPAGSNRSNVAWDFYPPETYISGDDFLLPSPGASGTAWKIDKIRVWAIAGNAADDVPPFELGDRYNTISLFLGADGPAGTSIGRVKTGSIDTGAHTTDNPDIVITPVTYSSGVDYQGSSGSSIQTWQIDFNNLGVFNPGELMFGVDATGTDKNYWFNHASNAALSGSPQDGADNRMRFYTGAALDTSITFDEFWDSSGYGWDKSSDHNIQVFATAVPEPATLLLLGIGLAGLGFARRRRND